MIPISAEMRRSQGNKVIEWKKERIMLTLSKNLSCLVALCDLLLIGYANFRLMLCALLIYAELKSALGLCIILQNSCRLFELTALIKYTLPPS